MILTVHNRACSFKIPSYSVVCSSGFFRGLDRAVESSMWVERGCCGNYCDADSSGVPRYCTAEDNQWMQGKETIVGEEGLGDDKGSARRKDI